MKEGKVLRLSKRAIPSFERKWILKVYINTEVLINYRKAVIFAHKYYIFMLIFHMISSILIYRLAMRYILHLFFGANVNTKA